MTRPTDRPIEPNSATQPNAASGQWGRVESLNHPTQAGLCLPASTEGSTSAGTFLLQTHDEDREAFGSRCLGGHQPALPAVLTSSLGGGHA